MTGVALLPNTGLPSLNSAGGSAFGGVLAVLEPFAFFLSSNFFLFSLTCPRFLYHLAGSVCRRGTGRTGHNDKGGSL